ncbi:hypothetical protein [Paucilactobacillus vaccinostercus]|nr:hypothetical protein [Paucilactobacillus vaccinostercus]
MLYHVIIKDLKATVLPMTILTILLACLTPILFSLKPLTISQASLPGELFIPLIAIICIPTIFLPDQAASIQSIINSKHYRLSLLHSIRVVWFVSILSILDLIIIVLYESHQASFQVWPLLGDFLAKIFLLTGLILLCYHLSKSIVITYILPITYFAFCLGYSGMGPLNLLSLIHGRPLSDSWIQLIIAILLLFADLLLVFSQTRFIHHQAPLE